MAKCPWQRGARRNGCTCRLGIEWHIHKEQDKKDPGNLQNISILMQISSEIQGISTFTFTIKAYFRRIYNKESLENNKIHIKMLISPHQFALTG